MVYKDLTSELAVLKSQLLHDSINWEKALEDIKSSTKNFSPWKTTWWEKRREELIKDSCEQCGTNSKEDIFVLQHTWHPSRLQELRSSAYEKYQPQHPFTDEEQSAIQKEIDQHDYVNREACPQCSAVALRYRKTFKNWLCLKCNTEFTQPIYVYDERAARDKKQELWKKKGKERYARFLGDSESQKQVILQLIDEYLRYLSFQDTVTYCRKCAYLADLHDKILCPMCKTNYMATEADICFKCKYGEGTGVYTLTRIQGKRWLREFTNSTYYEECQAKNPNDTMDFYICLLLKRGLEVVEVQADCVRIKAETSQVWQAIAGENYGDL